MKLQSILALLATLALGFHTALAVEEDTLLTKEMKSMNKSLRTLKRQVADSSKKDENLKLLESIKKNVEAASKLEPAKTKDVPAAEKSAYLSKFKLQMADLGKTYDELEAAVKADNQNDAKKALEKLSQEKEKGHKDFGADDDK